MKLIAVLILSAGTLLAQSAKVYLLSPADAVDKELNDKAVIAQKDYEPPIPYPKRPTKNPTVAQ